LHVCTNEHIASLNDVEKAKIKSSAIKNNTRSVGLRTALIIQKKYVKKKCH